MTRLTTTTTIALLAALTLTLASAPMAMAQDDTQTPQSSSSKGKSDTSDKAEFAPLMALVQHQAHTVFNEIQFALQMAEKHAAVGEDKQAAAWKATAGKLQEILDDLVKWYFKLVKASDTNDTVAQEMAQAADPGDVQEPGNEPQVDPKLAKMQAEYDLLVTRLAELTADYAQASAGGADKATIAKLAEAVQEIQARVASLAQQIAENS